MNLELELHNLKRMVLNESHISDLAKQKIADKIFQIEKSVAINYSQCCKSDSEQLCEKPKKGCASINVDLSKWKFRGEPL